MEATTIEITAEQMNDLMPFVKQHNQEKRDAAAQHEAELKAAESRPNYETTEQSAREILYKELGVSYASANVDNKTLKRMAERNKKPAPTHYPCIQARPFSLMR